MRHASAQIPSDQVAGRVIVAAIGNWERLSFAAGKDRQVWSAAAVYIGIRMALTPPAIVRICAPVRHDIFVDFLLQIDPNRPIGANYFVRANAGVGRDISIWIGNPSVGGVVAYVMRGSFDRRCDGTAEEMPSDPWPPERPTNWRAKRSGARQALSASVAAHQLESAFLGG